MSAIEDFNGDKHTRLQEAKKQAKALVDSMTRKDTALVIAFDDSAEVVQPLTTDASALRTAIDAVQPTDRRSRLKLAYKLAEAQTKYYPEQLRPNEKPTVFVYSDGRIADVKELSVQADIGSLLTIGVLLLEQPVALQPGPDLLQESGLVGERC